MMINGLSAKDILLKYYSEDSDLFRLLWNHSCRVAEKALSIVEKYEGIADREFVCNASLLHDIGIFRTDAPSIFCVGTEPYIRHGIIGGELLRSLGLDDYALVCERHTGAGLSCSDIINENLPLPHRDFLPVSIEEKIVCYADKFYSKSNPDKVKTVADIRRSLMKFGKGQVERFDEMENMFGS